MIYKDQPQEFNPRFDVVSCFVEHNEEILLLHRQDHKPEGDTWGVPAGKVDAGEEISQTMAREIREETGLELPAPRLAYFGKVYVKYPEYDFIYHIFQTKLEQKPEIIINQKEHKDCKWATVENALAMPLIRDLDACIKLFYKI